MLFIDLKSSEASRIIGELNKLMNTLKAKNMKEGAADDKNFPWFLYWEIVWVIINNEFSVKHNVLDLGGSS